MFKQSLLASTLLIPAMMLSCGNSNKATAESEFTSFEKPKDCGAYNMPYVRYDSKDAKKGGEATLEKISDFDYHKTASEASNQEYIALHTTNDFISWKINESANGVTVRFTLPDNESGESVGQKSSLDIFINDNKVKEVPLDSRWTWQYFKTNVSEPLMTVTDYAMMRFDEVHFLLAESLKPGDVVTIKKSTNDNLDCGVDFIEIEEVAAPIAQPENSLSVKDFGAKGDGQTDDYNAIIKCINAAQKSGKTVYFPEGTYNINDMLKLDLDGTNIQGAGMWYTNFYFTNDNFRSGGICGNANKLRISDVYINGYNTRRLGQKDKDGNIVYVTNYGWEGRVLYQDQKGISGNFGDGSVIENVWVEHFECGIWIAPYAWVEGKENIFTTPEGLVWKNKDSGKEFKVPAGLVLDTCGAVADKDRTKNLRVSNVRLRNQYADGVNFAEGTSFSVFEHSNVRNCGDDGIASWSQKDAGPKTPANKGNIFRYNTVELGWRAGGIGMFGGGGHEIHHCYVAEHMLSAGIRFTADFPGSPLDIDPENPMRVHDCVIYKCGTTSDLFTNWLASIDVHGSDRYPLENIQFENITIIDSQTDGIQLWGGNMKNIIFKDITIKGIGKGYKPSKESYDINAHGGKGNAKFINVTNSSINNPDNYDLEFTK